jgi:uncharacterized protein YcfL
MKKLYIAIGIVFLVFLAIGCSGSNSGSDNTQTQTVAPEQTALTLGNFTLTPESYGGYSVTGTAVANKDLKYAQINAQFFDADGALVYNSLTNTQNIKAGTTWKYKIPCLVDSSVKVASCNVTEGPCN